MFISYFLRPPFLSELRPKDIILKSKKPKTKNFRLSAEIYTHTHTYIYTHTRGYSLMHSLMHAHTHTHTHTHISFGEHFLRLCLGQKQDLNKTKL